MFNFKHFAAAGIIAILVLYVPQAIASDPPAYKSIEAGYTSHNPGLVEICDIIQNLNSSQTKVNLHNPHNNGASDYWCGFHKILNNESGNSNDKSDDYHLCHVYSSGSTAAINTFDIDLPIGVLELTGEKLYAISEIAGSSYGGNPSTRFSNKIYNSSDSIVTGSNSRLAVSMNSLSEAGRNSQFTRQSGQGSQGERFFNIVVTLSQLP